MVCAKIILLMLMCLSPWRLLAADLLNIQIAHANRQAIITLNFNDQPIYSFFQLHNPDRVVLDIRQSIMLQRLPLNFGNNNLIKCIRTSQPRDTQSIRLVFELTHPAKTHTTMYRAGTIYKVVFTITNKHNAAMPAPIRIVMDRHLHSMTSAHNPLSSNRSITIANNNRIMMDLSCRSDSHHAVIVAIDAGHGGQDPGAIGVNGLKEKNVTIAIARKLKAILDSDSMFKGVLTRGSDSFISVMGRSEVARKQNANLLVSIHANAAPNRAARGASVWVLSTRRANSEMANWLEQHKKQSELLGGVGDMLSNRQVDPYLSQVVLDLQFGHSQRVGYDVAVKVIQQLKQVSALHKWQPKHASLGVLRSPDIPSLLVETGFISNPLEERLLGSNAYQEKIARSIYRGLRSYFLTHPLQFCPN